VRATSRTLDAPGWLLLALGVGLAANALWMLAAPAPWYRDLPAGVPDTGPFNAHFVRDIGCAFLAVGTALAWAAFAPARRLPLAAISALFLVAHAALHAFDTLRGALDAHHWWLDLPGVYLPALVVAAAVAALARREGGPHATDPHREAA
jgi:hypothetical protein